MSDSFKTGRGTGAYVEGMSDNVFVSARTFIRTEARVVERRLFATLFEGAPAAGVSAALGAYRNPDGGFGHGLEPDKVCPASLPLDVEIAFETLAAAGHADADLLGPACDYLTTVTTPEGAVALCTPAIESYPRAEHVTEWMYAPGANPTSGLAGLLLELGFDHPWRDTAAAYTWNLLEGGELPDEVHALKEILVFLAHTQDRARAEKHAPAVVEQVLRNHQFQIDPDATGYGLNPLHVAPRADSPWRGLFTTAQIDGHLDKLAADQQNDGGWPITWDPPGTTSRMAWRGRVTIDALQVLISYGRLSAPDQR